MSYGFLYPEGVLDMAIKINTEKRIFTLETKVTPHGVGRCPQGRGDRSVRGGPAKLVEGFCEILFIKLICDTIFILHANQLSYLQFSLQYGIL